MILLTGAAGFIGYHVAEALLLRGERVLGVDDLNPYYDPALKAARLRLLAEHPGFRFVQASVADAAAISHAVASADAGPGGVGIDRVVHLAAQAGVRHSMAQPFDYASSNLQGHLVILELCRRLPGLRHLVYASSSSVYGSAASLPSRETDRCDTPTSLYAASKLADELMSHAYGHLFTMPMTGLRFFTVYGPWGRPDMAYFIFAEAILRGEPVTLYDGGRLRRDFTYVDDIVAGVLGCLDRPPEREPRVLNIGNSRAESVATMVQALEAALGRRAVLVDEPRPRADVAETLADVSAIAALTGYAPSVPLAEGIARFAAWFLAWRGKDGPGMGRHSRSGHGWG